MRLDEAKELAREADRLAREQPQPQPPRPAAAVAGKSTRPSPREPNARIWFGVVPGSNRDGWRLAIRVQTQADLAHLPERVQRLPAGEKDVRVTGIIRATRSVVPEPGQLQARVRPLRAGHSIGHYRITAGTLGAFVSGRTDGVTRILSNNHVLSHTNHALLGDPILQPGHVDGGCDLEDVAGSLHAFVPLGHNGNRVDAALANIHADAMPADLSLPGIGSVTSWWTEVPEVGLVAKVGRTTGLTRGRITAIGVGDSQVPVRYGPHTLWFLAPIEVQGEGAPFSDGGDSGSLVVDGDRSAVGLLFAGDGQATYLNPIAAVLDALGADLLG
jgi:hypothetical protein